MQTELPIEIIVLFLKELSREEKYETEAIRVARGKYKYKNTLIKRVKKLIYG